jgi:hypothetical protein
VTPKHLFDVWAAPGGPWSDWVKPVLFAHFTGFNVITADSVTSTFDTSWAPPADGTTALVIDLPGAAGVWAAAELAKVGYRPIPLYNAIPSRNVASTCDILPIIRAIADTTTLLDQLNLPYAAPPAFLLDASRRVGIGGAPQPGMFDNRSVSLPTDFPSASYLVAHGVRQVFVVQQKTISPQTDLVHTLLRWKQAQIPLFGVSLEPPKSEPIVVARPWMFRGVWQRMLAMSGLRKNPIGGFGGLLPYPSESHYGGGG